MAAVGEATHFHTTSVQPSWGPNLLRVAQVGLHVFYRFGHAPSSAFAQTTPEMTAHPVFASAETSAPTSPEIRLASALVIEAPVDAPAALRGPVEVEPAPAVKTPTSQPKIDGGKPPVATPS